MPSEHKLPVPLVPCAVDACWRCCLTNDGLQQQVYSNIKKFRDDLTAYPPDFFVCVPLVLDTLHSRVRQRHVVLVSS